MMSLWHHALLVISVTLLFPTPAAPSKRTPPVRALPVTGGTDAAFRFLLWAQTCHVHWCAVYCRRSLLTFMCPDSCLFLLCPLSVNNDIKPVLFNSRLVFSSHHLLIVSFFNSSLFLPLVGDSSTSLISCSPWRQHSPRTPTWATHAPPATEAPVHTAPRIRCQHQHDEDGDKCERMKRSCCHRRDSLLQLAEVGASPPGVLQPQGRSRESELREQVRRSPVLARAKLTCQVRSLRLWSRGQWQVEELMMMYEHTSSSVNSCLTSVARVSDPDPERVTVTSSKSPDLETSRGHRWSRSYLENSLIELFDFWINFIENTWTNRSETQVNKDENNSTEQ